MTDERTNIPARHGDYCRMQVRCPRCGGQGLVPWDRLNGVLRCGGCGASCRLDAFGKPFEAPPPTAFFVQVRSWFSEWQHVRVLLGPPRRTDELVRGAWRPNALGAILASVVALAVLVGAFAYWPRPPRPSESPQVSLPTSLDGRATAWLRAWLAHDTAQLLQFVEPTRDRQFRRWLSSRPPPRPIGPEAFDASRYEVESVTRDEPRLADVTVSIQTKHSPRAEKKILLKQVWRQRDGVWYFWPDL